MPQPRNQAELVSSIQNHTLYGNGSRVVATIATRPFADLPTPIRVVTTDMLLAAAVADQAITALYQPGAEIRLNQTDEWYRTHDTGHQFNRLIGITHTVGARTR